MSTSPATIQSLRLWWDGSQYTGHGTAGFQITDLSGNGNHGTQSTSINQPTPTGGKMRFDGVSDRVSVSNVVADQNKLTMVFRLDHLLAPPPSGEDIWGTWNASATEPEALTVRIAGATGVLVINVAVSQFAFAVGEVSGIPWESEPVISIVYDGTLTGDSNRLKVYVNGAQQTVSFTTPGIPAKMRNDDNGSFYGSFPGGGNYLFADMVYTFICHDALGDDERAVLENWDGVPETQVSKRSQPARRSRPAGICRGYAVFSSDRDMTRQIGCPPYPPGEVIVANNEGTDQVFSYDTLDDTAVSITVPPGKVLKIDTQVKRINSTTGTVHVVANWWADGKPLNS